MKLRLQVNEDNKALQTAANVTTVLKLWNYPVWVEEFSGREMINDGGKVRALTDTDVILLHNEIQRTTALVNVSLNAVQCGLTAYAAKKRVDSVKEFISTPVWDKVERIEHFFNVAMGASANAYTRAVSRNFWRSLAVRVLRPGSKVDNMVVLEGAQGIGKSTALGIIAGDWYGTSGADFGHKDFLQCLDGKMLVEIEELDSFGKSDVRTIKRILSTARDTYRPSYGRRAADFDRRCIFVGTTNDSEYLEDATGGRRFWPVVVTEIDLDFIKENRAQLFAEAVADIKAGKTWWEVPDEAIEIQASRTRVEPWVDAVDTWLRRNPTDDGHRMDDIAMGALKVEINNLGMTQVKRIAAALRSLGWVSRTVYVTGDRRARRWVRAKPQLHLIDGNAISDALPDFGVTQKDE